MAHVERTAEFDADVTNLRPSRERLDDAINGLTRILQGNPTAYDKQAGVDVRVATTRPYPGAEDIQIAYLYVEESDTVRLLRAELA